MVEQTNFRSVIEFLGQVGVYDVILPFLLVFTIVFAILEKTKILGIEKVDSKELTKKNLNAMVAFVVAFLVVASTRLVAVINEVMANVVLLLVLSICFLLLVGSFFADKQFSLEQHAGWVRFFMVLMFIGIVLIFLNALDWLEGLYDWFRKLNMEYAATIMFFVIVLGFLWYVVRDSGSAAPKSEGKK